MRAARGHKPAVCVADMQFVDSALEIACSADTFKLIGVQSRTHSVSMRTWEIHRSKQTHPKSRPALLQTHQVARSRESSLRFRLLPPTPRPLREVPMLEALEDTLGRFMEQCPVRTTRKSPYLTKHSAGDNLKKMPHPSRKPCTAGCGGGGTSAVAVCV
ncbi:hypothetical protein AcV7_004556 [Taiwanofungus camphoratus]|nr:hypothetical protein AcV7_004556 [Antrodia cinnamomea]